MIHGTMTGPFIVLGIFSQREAFESFAIWLQIIPERQRVWS